MAIRNNFSWEFACPKFVDFQDPKFMELNPEEADAYFDSEHEFSFSNHNLSEALKVESILAEADSMSSPIVTPSRPTSSASNYRTPPDGSKSDLESDEVFYTTRKSYSLRDTECRRLKLIGASPYRIPGGTTTGKKKSRRPPFTPKLVQENAKQIEEEILVQNLNKALFLDDDENDSSKKDENNENIPQNENEREKEIEKENSFRSPQKKKNSTIMSVTQGSNDYSMELMAVSQDIVYECVANVLDEKDNSMLSESQQTITTGEEEKISEKSLVEETPIESTEIHSEVITVDEPQSVPVQYEVCSSIEQVNSDKNFESTESLQTNEYVDETSEQNTSTEKSDNIETIVQNNEVVPVDLEKEEEKEKANVACSQGIPEIRISPSSNIKSTSTSSDEGHNKSTAGFNSDNCWTDVDDENAPTTSKTQEKRRRPLRRESFVKSSATLASTVKKADPQKRLYRLLSYTAPPRNKYRSLAELSRDFETKIRAYTPPNLKAVKTQWTPTKPVSPKLTACKRKRTLTCVSMKDQEESIAQSIKKNTFKATPFNKKTYLSTVNVGVKRVDPKPTTKPIPFCFRSEKRIEARRSKVPADLFNKLTSESAKKGKK